MSGLVKPSNLPSFEDVEKVAELKNRGLGDRVVAKRLGMQTKDVKALYKHYTDMLKNDPDAVDRAVDLLNVMIQQYDDLIRDTHELLEKIRNEPFDDKYAGQEIKAIALVEDLIKQRLTMVQQAGLLDANEIGDQYAEIEEKANILMSILRHDLCDECRRKVKDKFAVATGAVEAVQVFED